MADIPPGYDVTRYERPSVTVDVVIFSLINARALDPSTEESGLQLCVLLIRRMAAPFAGRWAIPGGFVQMDESLEAAALRELQEETGMTDVYLEQLYTFGDPQRDPRTRVITVAYFALVPANTAARHRPGSDAAETRWFFVHDLPELAFDHREVLDYALKRLRYKLEYTMVGFELLPDEFTLTELQNAYELILGEDLDKRNFRRKILSADVVEETGGRRTDGEGRPATLYRYRPGATAEVKTRRLFP